ncbi:MAG: hypothetical protein Q8Q09_11685 [Deltaproteobacteria bacterium]|nr:hypothetical protein [Deltaproteobacteria bacterium]
MTQTADELQQFLAQWSDTLASEGAPSQPQRDAFFAQTLRRALWASSVDERWSLIRALTTGITGVAVIRFGDCRVPSATMDPARFVQRPRRDLARAPRELLPDAVLWLDLDDDLRVRRDEARVLSSHPAVIIASRNPLADGLRSLHAILALIHPELVGTRRHFLQRFGPLMEGRTSRDDASMSLALAQSVLPSTPGFRAPMACWPGSKHLAIDGWTLRYER